MRRVFVVIALVTIAAGIGAPAQAAQGLGDLILTSGEVGTGYVVESLPGGAGSGVGAPTLDLCGLSFPSEGRRVDRIQVTYAMPGKEPGVSNEVVRYRVGGAAQALREAASVPGRCRERAVTLADGSTAIYRVSRLRLRGLPAGAVALSIVIMQDQGRTMKTTHAVAVYLRYGDTFSGVYAYGGASGAQQRLVARLAGESHARLEQALGQIA